MPDSVRPHRRKPTRLPRPWDSPGKNTGVGCHFLLQCMKVKGESEVAQSCLTLSNPMDCSLPGPSVHGIFQARVLEWGAIAFSSQTAVIVETSSLYFWRGPIGFWEFLGNHDDNTVITSKAGILQAKASQLWRECQRYQFVKTCFRFWPEVKSGVWSAPAEKQSQFWSSGDGRLAPFFHCLMDPFLPASPHIYWAPTVCQGASQVA